LIGFYLKKFATPGIARAASVSKKWLQDYVNNKYAQTSHHVKVSDKLKVKLEIEWDEAWSFVGNKGNKQWIRLALFSNSELFSVIRHSLLSHSDEVAPLS